MSETKTTLLKLFEEAFVQVIKTGEPPSSFMDDLATLVENPDDLLTQLRMFFAYILGNGFGSYHPDYDPNFLRGFLQVTNCSTVADAWKSLELVHPILVDPEVIVGFLSDHCADDNLSSLLELVDPFAIEAASDGIVSFLSGDKVCDGLHCYLRPRILTARQRIVAALKESPSDSLVRNWYRFDAGAFEHLTAVVLTLCYAETLTEDGSRQSPSSSQILRIATGSSLPQSAPPYVGDALNANSLLEGLRTIEQMFWTLYKRLRNSAQLAGENQPRDFGSHGNYLEAILGALSGHRIMNQEFHRAVVQLFTRLLRSDVHVNVRSLVCTYVTELLSLQIPDTEDTQFILGAFASPGEVVKLHVGLVPFSRSGELLDAVADRQRGVSTGNAYVIVHCLLAENSDITRTGARLLHRVYAEDKAVLLQLLEHPPQGLCEETRNEYLKWFARSYPDDARVAQIDVDRSLLSSDYP